MTVQEKIQKKAEGYGIFASMFLEGAEFALENQWIDVEKDLPCNHKELIKIDTSRTFFVVVWNGKSTDLDCMIYKKGKWEWLCNNSNTHWMPIPKLPKE